MDVVSSCILLKSHLGRFDLDLDVASEKMQQSLAEKINIFNTSPDDSSVRKAHKTLKGTKLRLQTSQSYPTPSSVVSAQ
jgi:hypothetical protein